MNLTGIFHDMKLNRYCIFVKTFYY